MDVLVNNAGIAGHSKTLWERDPEEWKRVFDINITAVFL